MTEISFLLLCGWVGVVFFSYVGAEFFCRQLEKRAPKKNKS